jgi:3-hydroxyisobutyrate dehydrogenase
MFGTRFLHGKFDPPNFALRLLNKDVQLALQLGREVGVPMRLANLVHAEMTEAVAKGMGDMDSRAYLQLQLERAGVEIAVGSERLAAAVKAAQG